MSSPFEFYFPPIFFSEVLSEKDDQCLSKLIECMRADSSEIESQYTSEIETSEILMIDNKEIGKVIGRGGYNIKKIRKGSRATIKIFDKFFGSERKVLITGEENDVKITKEKIMKYLK